MASLNGTPEVKIGIGNGTTWGTAADLTASNKGFLLYASQLSLTNGEDVFSPRDVGFGNFVQSVIRLKQHVGVNVSCDFNYGGLCWQILANFMGTAAIGAETTTGQGDYPHTLTMASASSKFQTISFLVEDNYVLELPSIKWTSISMSSDANGVGVFSAQGIADQVVDSASASNTAAEVSALTFPTYEAAVLGGPGGTNHYVRVNTQSGGALSSTNNLQLLNWSLTMDRPLQDRFVLRGASSQYTLEPKQLGVTKADFKFQMPQIDNSVYSGITEWNARTQKKCEIFFDGTAIGTGVNRSVKLQLPSLYPLFPAGYDVPNNNTFQEPTYSFRVLQATSAPTGMSGITDYLKTTIINTRAVTYLN